MESAIQVPRTKDPESSTRKTRNRQPGIQSSFDCLSWGIRNPLNGIPNPGLSWILLHRAKPLNKLSRSFCCFIQIKHILLNKSRYKWSFVKFKSKTFSRDMLMDSFVLKFAGIVLAFFLRWDRNLWVLPN